MSITAKEFASKYREKHEVYHFLAHDCGIYLPHYDTVTVWHLRDIASGRRRKILGKDVQYLSVPQYFGLSVVDILEYGTASAEVKNALPVVEKETLKMPRQYLINVIYTLMGLPFRMWVGSRVDERHKKVADERNMNIQMDPEIAAIFRSSTAVSTNNGRSFNMMRITAQRRRGKAQIREEKLREQEQLQETERKLKELEDLKAQQKLWK